MTLPASGQISIDDIYTECGEENPINGSLKNISDGSVVTINTASPSYPDGNAPYNISKWYGYNHNATSSSWGGSWNAGNWSIERNPGTTSYLNRSITFSGMTTDPIDVYYSLNSGTVRGGLSVAVSTSSFPSNSATFTTVNSSTGNFLASSISACKLNHNPTTINIVTPILTAVSKLNVNLLSLLSSATLSPYVKIRKMIV